MKNEFHKHDWERRLRPFPDVWERIMGERLRPFPPPPPPGRPFPPPPPVMGPPPPPGLRPPIMPDRGCCTKAVRFNPHRRGR